MNHAPPAAENDWRIRVGNYRVIYEIVDEVRIVKIVRVRHRKDSYRGIQS